MFKAISWGQYAGAVFVLLLLYYAYVAAVYYRAELLGLAKGKGKAGATPAPAPAPARSSLIGNGPLIAKPAITLPAPPPEVAGPGPAAPGLDEEESSGADQAQNEEAGELPEIDLPTAEVTEKDDLQNANFVADNVDNITNFTDQDNNESFSAPKGFGEATEAEYNPGFTVGVAQLGDYFERAAEGQLTQEELVEQAPALENTDLLATFYKTNSKSAQQLTSHLYAGVEEPTLD